MALLKDKVRKERLIPLFLRLYRTDDRFRGFFDFGLFGAVALFFLSPPSVPLNPILSWWTGTTAPPTSGSLPSAGVAGALNSAGVQTPVGKPAAAPTNAPPQIVDADRDIRKFLHLSKETERPKIEQAVDLLTAKSFKVLEEHLATIDQDEPVVPFIRGVELKWRDGPGGASLANFRLSADRGYPLAMYELAETLRLGKTTPADPAAAFDLYQKAWDLGYDPAGFWLARTYYSEGLLGYTNPARAAEIFAKIAERVDQNGIHHALNDLGYLYATGRGGPKDLTKANELWRKGASLGNAVSMRNLGLLARSGRLGPKDIGEFIRRLTQASEAGDAEAQYRLGIFYAAGEEGRAADPLLGTRFLKQAALKNHGLAQLEVGRIYEEGRGLPQDLVQAYVNYGLAMHNRAGEASSRLSVLERTMKPDELDRSKRLLAGALPNR